MPRDARAGCMSAKRFVGRWPALSPRKSTRSGAAVLVKANRPTAKIVASRGQMNFMVLKEGIAGVPPALFGVSPNRTERAIEAQRPRTAVRRSHRRDADGSDETVAIPIVK